MTPAVQQRAFAAHQPKWQRFQTNLMVTSTQTAAATKDQPQEIHPYQRQYAHVYHQRLALLAPRCWDNIPNNPQVTRVQRVLELRENVKSVAVGTLVKEGGSSGDEQPVVEGSKCREADTLYLEDESGRVALQTDLLHQYTTGVVVGVQGTVGTDGVLVVEQFYIPALAPQPSLSKDATGTPHLMIVSGLQCGDANVSGLPRDMLVSYLEGRLGHKAADTSRVVLAGGLASKAQAAMAVKDLDGFLVQIAAAGIPVDVFPGKDDPTTANWPQRPLHKSLLKQTNRHLSGLVSRTPNPYAANHSDKAVLGTDGTNVHDLTVSLLTKDNRQKVTELEALQQTLEWCHVCPTGPDSVPTVPHADTDPMVIKDTPHLYFAGNCSKFATAMVHDCRLVCIPKFAETGQVVLVNLETMDVELLRFEE